MADVVTGLRVAMERLSEITALRQQKCEFTDFLCAKCKETKKKNSILRLCFHSISPPTCELLGRSPAGPTGMWERLSLEGISPSAIVVQQLSITQYSVVHHSELVSEKPPSWEGKSNK